MEDIIPFVEWTTFRREGNGIKDLSPSEGMFSRFKVTIVGKAIDEIELDETPTWD